MIIVQLYHDLKIVEIKNKLVSAVMVTIANIHDSKAAYL